MPDWVVHVALTGAAGWRVFEDRALLLTGAVLPDVGIAFILLFCDILGFRPLDSYLYFGPLHTPSLCLVLSAAIALLFRDFRRAFLPLAAGVLVHFLLDVSQWNVGAGVLLLYPASGRLFSLDLVHTDGTAGVIVSALLLPGAAAMAWLAGRGGDRANPLRLEARRLLPAAGLLALFLVVPLLTPRLLVRDNAHFAQFFRDPSTHVGREVGFARSRVVSTDPVTLLEMGREFVVRGLSDVRVGEWVSIEGIYDGKAVSATRVVRHNYWAKPIFSLVGLAFLLAVWLRDPRIRTLLRRRT